MMSLHFFSASVAVCCAAASGACARDALIVLARLCTGARCLLQLPGAVRGCMHRVCIGLGCCCGGRAAGMQGISWEGENRSWSLQITPKRAAAGVPPKFEILGAELQLGLASLFQNPGAVLGCSRAALDATQSSPVSSRRAGKEAPPPGSGCLRPLLPPAALVLTPPAAGRWI